MGDQTSSPSQIIALPRGGGAQRGLGETFSPDLHTGTGNFTVPIAVPPGRNGFQPKLNLGYSTGNGNSVHGTAWPTGPYIHNRLAVSTTYEMTGTSGKKVGDLRASDARVGRSLASAVSSFMRTPTRVVSKVDGVLKDQPHALDMHRAKRCGAKTRSGKPCRPPAMANGRCRMHGEPSPWGTEGKSPRIQAWSLLRGSNRRAM
jgi:hypothetical protein